MIYEPFSQTGEEPVSLGGLSGGVGLDTWSINQTVNVEQTPTLSYGQLENTGGQADLLSGNGVDSWTTTTTVLADNNLLDDGASLWFSFMYSKTASGGATNEKGGFALGTDRLDGAYNGTNMTDGGNGIGMEIKATQIAAGTWSGGGNVSTGGTTPIALNTSYLVVGRIDWGATSGDDETITVYLPDTSNLGTLGSAVSTTTMGGVDQTLFDTISMTQRNSGGTVTYDEIRFGASFEEVTPVAASETNPQITSISAVGTNLWDLTLTGEAETDYEFYSSTTLDFTAATLIENLVQGDAGDAGTVGGTNDSVLTTDGSGDGKVRVTLTGSPRDFVRAESTP